MRKSYNLVNWKTGDITTTLTAKRVGEELGISSNMVNTYCNRRIAVSDYIILPVVGSNTMSDIQKTIYVPSAYMRQVRRETKEQIIDLVKSKHRKSYKSGHDILVLDEGGNELEILHSYKEAANHFSVPLGTVKSRLHRAAFMKKAPKMCLRKDYDAVRSLHF